MVPPPASCGEERHIIAPLRCKPPSPFQVIWTKTIVMQGTGTGGRLCSPNLRFWRPALSIELHPYMCASRLIVTRRISAPIAELWRSFQRALSFSLRNCATLRSSGSDPASGGTSRPCPALALRAACPSLAVTSPFLGCLCSACPRLSGVSAPWPLERSALQGQPRKAFLRFAPGYYLSPDCGEASQGGGLNWLRERCGLPSPRPDSNRRRFNHPYSWAALPTELQGHRVPHSRGSGFRHHPICCVKEVKDKIV